MRANTRKPIPQKLKAEPPPKRDRPPKVVTVNAEVVQLHREPRHPSYSESIATEILDQLGEGRTLRQISSQPGFPQPRTIKRWVADDVQGFAERYERACKLQADAIFDEVIAISDGEFIDYTEVQAARLKIETRKWYLAKIDPQRFGDKVEVTSRTERLSDGEIDTQLQNLLEAADHAALPPPARKHLAKTQR